MTNNDESQMCLQPSYMLQACGVFVSTFVHTTTIGIPRLCVSVPSPKGSSTLSSSSPLLCGVPSSPLPGSVYSWNCLTTAHMQKQRLTNTLKSGASKQENPLLIFPASLTYAGAPSLAAFRAAPGVCRCVPERRRPTSGESPGRSTAATCRPLSTATCR